MRTMSSLIGLCYRQCLTGTTLILALKNIIDSFLHFPHIDILKISLQSGYLHQQVRRGSQIGLVFQYLYLLVNFRAVSLVLK